MEPIPSPTYITKGEAIRMLGITRTSQFGELGLRPVATAKGIDCEYDLFAYRDIINRGSEQTVGWRW